MTMISIGDLSTQFILRRHNGLLKQDMMRLTQEMTTGQKSDLADALTGDYSYLSDIQRSLSLLDGYQQSTKEAGLFTGAMQSVLGKVQDSTAQLGSDLMTATESPLPGVVRNASSAAADTFRSLVSRLNTDIAGRSLFSGVATDRAPLLDGDAMLDELRGAVAGAVTESDVLDAIDDWFHAPGGGFETTGYRGAGESLSPFQLGESQSVTVNLRADADEIRDMLRMTAVAALAGDTALGYSKDWQLNMLRRAGSEMLGAQDGFTAMRADLGFVEARVEEISTRNAAARSSLEIARSDLASADPYETATELKNVQGQLETLYTLTVRLSRLSLTDFMR
ncbi:flagellar hook-associated protein 3 FlgL [Salinihabitans flavidus]|uniref:Flagellar hook-associated protein 3 FlgL n=1 Tax=Salinihabitans flavidus TaxID=569882 RepID=A0A1H8LRS7_9RHOB|nr:flagellin [Salinihabitans flavidus]SEO07852.1 flagellar hook-associated protein 3 FlgL [Salinihabitans flavidus]